VVWLTRPPKLDWAYKRAPSRKGEKAQKGRRLRKEEKPKLSVGQHSVAPAFTGEVHGRRDRATEPTTEAERTLKSGTPGGHRPHTGFRPGAARTLRGDEDSVVARFCLGLAALADVVNDKRVTALKGVRLLERIKAL